MNKILKLSAIALLASSTSLMAQSKSFEGVSLGLSLSAIGAELSGSHTNTSGGTTNNNTSSTSGSLGKITEIAAIDLSYAFATGSNGLIAIGASYIPGKAKFGTGTLTDTNSGSGSDDNSGSATGQIKDPYTIYIAPTYAVSKDSALYAKLSYAHADVDITKTGITTITSKSSKMEGWGYAIGSKTFLNNNTYIGVEGSYTDYDSISATLSNGQTVTADPKIVQATVTIGYKF